MEHPIYRVIGFDIVGPFSLEIRFDDETTRRIDFGPILYGELYGPLRDTTVFRDRPVYERTGSDLRLASLPLSFSRGSDLGMKPWRR